MNDDEQEHGPETACYSRTAFGLEPLIVCLCGWSVQGESWEEVGYDFDAHLDATAPKAAK